MVANVTHETAGDAPVEPAPRRDVYLTGFGKFGDVLENPTTFITQKLADHPDVTEAKVLEVSATGAAVPGTLRYRRQRVTRFVSLSMADRFQ